MKGFLFGILCVITVGVLCAAYQDGGWRELLQPRVEYVTREDGAANDQARDDEILRHQTWVRRGSACVPDPANPWNHMRLTSQIRERERDAERREASMRHDMAVRYGWEQSGRPDLDDAMLAGDRLGRLDPDHWPLERIAHTSASRTLWNAMPSHRAEGGEEFIGASEAQPPGWTGAPLGRPRPARERVSTGKAIQRFIFGVPEEERRRL